MLWLLIPVVDCLRLIVTRVAIGRSPFEPDRDHLHHRLMAVLVGPRPLLDLPPILLSPGVDPTTGPHTPRADEHTTSNPAIIRPPFNLLLLKKKKIKTNKYYL